MVLTFHSSLYRESLYVLTGTNLNVMKYRRAKPPSNIPLSGVDIQCFYIHTFAAFFPSCQVKRIWFIATNRSTCLPPIANHSGGAHWKSWTVASFVLSFLFHVCLSEMAKPFRGLTILHLDFECFLFLFSSTDMKWFIATWLWTTRRLIFFKFLTLTWYTVYYLLFFSLL